MSDSELRQRRGPTENVSTTAEDFTDESEDNSSRSISILDIFRVVITLLGITLAVSFYTTSGESIIFGYKPWWLKPVAIQRFIRGPAHLTLEQLALFNGSDPNRPVYLAVNGTIFDVSEGRHTYGPGGSYSVFAGKDATRAFVTGCFLDDQTHDLRGAEDIYIPVDDPEENITNSERKLRTEKERRDAKKKVSKEVQKWEDFYKNSDKYIEIGRIVGLEESRGPAPRLCDSAEKGRPKRKKMKTKSAAPGKPVQ